MAGLLGEVYSAIDTKRRQLKGLLSDPVETVRQYMFNQNEDAGKSLGLLGQTYIGPNGKASLANMSPTSQAAHDKLTSDLTAAVMGATVWHGSPHKFDKFDSAKIGTGEGAQAYGHGGYLADEPKVAKRYQKQLSENKMLVGGSEIGLNPGGVYDQIAAGKALGIDPRAASMAMQDKAGDISLLNNLRSQKGNYPKTSSSDVFGDVISDSQAIADRQKLAELFKQAKSAKKQTEFNIGGFLYKVDLPDEQIAKMLDWDKPLSGQAPEVQAMAQSLMKGGTQNQFGWLSNADSPGGLSMTGKQFLNSLQGGESQMQKAGIPGIRYLDGGSRAGGAGSSNYVIFPGNEGLLSIMERNGQALK